MTIAITGATGQFGRLVVHKLKDKVPSSDIVALVRTPAKASDLGVAVREADYSKPETLDKALSGIDTLLLISGNELGQRATQHQNVIEAAKKAGLKRIIYTSLLHADTSRLSLAAEHEATEASLKTSGISFTILRNGWYTENYTGAIPGALAGGALIGSAGEGKISSATRADYAEAAVAVLSTEGHDGKTYELAGDEAYTLSDLAAEISRQTSQTIPYKNLPEAEYAAALMSFGLPEGFAQAIAGWDVCASQGSLFEKGRQLSALIGRPTTPLSVAVAEALQQAAPIARAKGDLAQEDHSLGRLIAPANPNTKIIPGRSSTADHLAVRATGCWGEGAFKIHPRVEQYFSPDSLPDSCAEYVLKVTPWLMSFSSKGR